MKTSESIKTIASALIKAQKDMGSVSKSATNPFYKSRYADINAFLEVAIKSLNDQGIALLQPTHSQDGAHYVETILLHESGEFISSGSLKLELNKVDMQQLGSSITYARRYQIQALMGMQAMDDDNESAMNRTRPQAPPLSKRTVEATKIPQQLVELAAATAGITISGPTPEGAIIHTPTEAPAPRTSFRKSTPKPSGNLF